jgi:L-lysine exporter family protein LysE/ArgO
MMIEAFIHGVLLALGLILPLGVQNVFIFNQGGSQPALKKAFPSVITASVCDTVLILTSVLGLSILLLQVPFLKTVLYGCGIIFLTYMGWTIWQTKQQENEKTEALSSKKQITLMPF